MDIDDCTMDVIIDMLTLKHYNEQSGLFGDFYLPISSTESDFYPSYTYSHCELFYININVTEYEDIYTTLDGKHIYLMVNQKNMKYIAF